MDNELRDKIAKIIDSGIYKDDTPIEIADQILALLAPELERARILNDKIGHLVGTDIAVLVEKAAKWDRVLEMNDEMRSCAGCKYDNEGNCICDDICCFNAVVDALDGGENGNKR